MKKSIVLAAAMLALNFAASAQSGDTAGGPPPPPPHGFAGFAPGPIGMGMHPGKTVTGAPYSADTNNSMVQALSDGNTITRSTSGHVARDNQGRTYLQQDISGGPWAEKGSKKMTFITDPVAGYSYVLNEDEKVAIRRPLKSHEGDHAGFSSAEGKGRPDSQDHVVTELGQQMISGVPATGKSITRTIPAGSIGNAQPIISKGEVWTSTDLQIVVLSKHSDPRMGQSTYTLSNIQRSEPAATLFQVPSDYTVKDAPAAGHRGGMQH